MTQTGNTVTKLKATCITSALLKKKKKKKLNVIKMVSYQMIFEDKMF